MTGLLATALSGVFVLSNFPAATALASSTGLDLSPEPTYQVLDVTLTAYNAVEGQTDGSPDRTAIGVYSNPEVVAARSKDLADELPYGTVIDVVADPASTDPNCGLEAVHDRIGYRVIADAMHPRKREQVDILFDTTPVRLNGKKLNPAVVLGYCKDVQIRVIGRIDPAKMPKTQTELAAMMGKAPLASR